MPAVFLALFHFLLSAPPYPAFAWLKVKVKLLSLWDPMDCSSPGSSVHGIFQARVLEWVAFSFSRESSQLRDQTRVSCIICRYFTV